MYRAQNFLRGLRPNSNLFSSKLFRFPTITLLRNRHLLSMTLLLGFGLFGYDMHSKVFNASSISEAVYKDAQDTSYGFPNGHCAVLVIHLRPEYKKEKIHQVFAALNNLHQIIETKNGEENKDDPLVSGGVGVDTSLWNSITGEKRNDVYHTRNSTLGSMPKTGGDFIIHVKGQSYSLCFEVIASIINKLPKDSVEKIEERYGFSYQDGRDLSGFLDGTMNPSNPIQRRELAVDERGGSYLMHQVWKHDLNKIASMDLKTQEEIVGRIKQNSVELKNLPPDSHVARTRDEHKNRILIVRQSQPYGTPLGEKGLLFLAYSNDINKFNIMLDRMAGVTDGIPDGILKFSTNYIGNYWYFPSKSNLVKYSKK